MKLYDLLEEVKALKEKEKTYLKLKEDIVTSEYKIKKLSKIVKEKEDELEAINQSFFKRISSKLSGANKYEPSAEDIIKKNNTIIDHNKKIIDDSKRNLELLAYDKNLVREKSTVLTAKLKEYQGVLILENTTYRKLCTNNEIYKNYNEEFVRLLKIAKKAYKQCYSYIQSQREVDERMLVNTLGVGKSTRKQLREISNDGEKDRRLYFYDLERYLIETVAIFDDIAATERLPLKHEEFYNAFTIEFSRVFRIIAEVELYQQMNNLEKVIMVNERFNTAFATFIDQNEEKCKQILLDVEINN